MALTGRKMGVVCIGLATALMVLVGVVRAANVDAAWDNGSTLITPSSCSVSFSGQYAPSPHTVNRNDTAFFYYNASWSDTRSGGSAVATHRFHMKIQWAVTNQKEAWFNATTTGSSSGSQQFSVNLKLDFAYTVDIRWDARVSSGLTCDSGVVTDQPATVVFQFP